MAESLSSCIFKTNLGGEFGNLEGTFRIFVSQQLAMKTANQLCRAECLFGSEYFLR
jgi:hypothetical protein